jgi:hypothetical protein
MHRHTQSSSGKQIPLALDPMANPASEAALRKAYGRLELSRRLSFEQAMSIRACAIGIRNLAAAIARRESSSNSRTLTRIDLAEDMASSLSFQPHVPDVDVGKGVH